MRVLITGGAGYVGSAILRHLLAHGHEAIAYDDLSAGNRQAVPGDRLIVGDIGHTAALTKALYTRGIEAVIHCAALASVPGSIATPAPYWRVNVGGTKSVLDAMCTTGVKRIIFASTAAAEGHTPYGRTKRACEDMIEDYVRAHDLKATAFRYYNVAGADLDGRHGEARKKEEHLIPLIFRAAMGGPPVRIFGDCARDYVHVADLAEAHRLALENPGRAERRFQIGTGVGTTTLEVLSACEAVVGRPIPHEMTEHRLGDPERLIAYSDPIREKLGWQPQHSDIATIVRTAWNWFRSHPGGYG